MPDPNKGKTAVVRDYQAAMKARGQNDFNLGSLEGYVNMRVLAEGLERAGNDPRAKLRSALAGIRNWDMGGFVVDYSGQAPYVARATSTWACSGPGRFLANSVTRPTKRPGRFCLGGLVGVERTEPQACPG